MKKLNEDGVVGSPPMNNTGNAAGLGNNPPGPSSVIARIRRKRVTTEEPTEPMPPISKEQNINTVFVARTLRNALDLTQWAKFSGLENLVQEENMHTTIAFSRALVDIDTLEMDTDPVVVNWDGPRSIERLGPTAIVLRFESQDLKQRWNYFKTKGCSWDFDDFKPHVTITWKENTVDISKITPYDGVLFFGPEIYKPINPKFL